MSFRSEGDAMNSTPVVVALFLAASALPGAAQTRERCEHEATRSATLQAGNGARLQLEAGAGSLRITGRAGLTEVRVRARACAATEALLGDLNVETRAGNGVIRIAARYPSSEGRDWNDGYAYLDLVVEVPAGMAAAIDDGSGSIVLEGLGALDVEDGSGDLTLTDIRGDVRIDDGSGNLTVERVTGDVVIDDGSGDVELRDIRGDVTLEDGSGDLDAGDVTGTVRVIDDGSGSIRVTNVGGDFVVDDDGSGSIRHSGVRGRVSIPDDD
jgi:hypothetical protein